MVSVTTISLVDSEWPAGQFVTVFAQLVIVWIVVWYTVNVVETPESVEVVFNPRRWWKCCAWLRLCAEPKAAKKATESVVNCILK